MSIKFVKKSQPIHEKSSETDPTPSKNLPGKVIPFKPDQALGIELTEDNMAEHFAVQHGGDFRYDCDRGEWFRWTGSKWELDATHRALDAARRLCRKHRGTDRRLGSKGAIKGVEVLQRFPLKLHRILRQRSSW